MKRFLSILLIFLLAALPLTVYASDGEPVCDYADLLTNSQEALLRETANAIYDTYGLNAVILTVNSLDGKTPQDYADDYYDYSGYGPDGILLLVSMEERDWFISTSGTAIDIFLDYDLYELEELLLPYLSDGDYYDCFSAFLDSIPEDCEYYISASQPRSVGSILITSLIIGAVIGGIALLIMRGTMNTKRQQSGAGDYMTSGSFHMTVQRDLFLYSQISKTRRQQQSTSGSTTHTGSSGRSHGGRGGKF